RRRRRRVRAGGSVLRRRNGIEHIAPRLLEGGPRSDHARGGDSARHRGRIGVKTMEDFRRQFVTSFDRISEILERTRTIAVLGMKTEAQRGQPSFDVPLYMADHGYSIIPVPVYYPETTHILGAPVYRTVSAIPGSVDMVNVFRRSQDVPQHIDDILAAQPRVVWMQLG